jgi:Ca-activated chloride channel family protein
VRKAQLITNPNQSPLTNMKEETTMANEVTLSYELNKNYFWVSDESQLAYLLIDIKPNAGHASATAPLNLCLVMDRSASMKGAKIENVKKAIHNIIDRMGSEDYLSLVSFNEESEVLVPVQPVIAKDTLKDIVNELTPRNGTAISTGMKVGMDELKKNLADNRINRMILLTDGQTYGDEDDCYTLACEAADKGILITALGVGDQWYEEVLDTIAEKSYGKSDYIAAPDDIITIFQEEMTSLEKVFAQSAMITLRLSEDVQLRKIYRVIPNISELEIMNISERDVSINLGEINSDQGQSLLAEIIMTPRQSGMFRISQAELVYDVPGENLFQQKVRKDIVAEFSNDETMCKKINPRVMNMAERASAYDLQTRAIEQAASGDISGATRKLRAAATRLLNLNEKDLAETALNEALNLAQKGSMSSTGTKKLRYETRKLTRRLVL